MFFCIGRIYILFMVYIIYVLYVYINDFIGFFDYFDVCTLRVFIPILEKFLLDKLR